MCCIGDVQARPIAGKQLACHRLTMPTTWHADKVAHHGLAISSDGSHAAVTVEHYKHCVVVYALPDWRMVTSFGEYGVCSVGKCCFTKDNTILVAEPSNGALVEYSLAGARRRCITSANNLFVPYCVACNDDVVVASNRDTKLDLPYVFVFGAVSGELLGAFGAHKSVAGQAHGIHIHCGHIYVAESRKSSSTGRDRSRVSVWTLSGEFVQFSGATALTVAADVTVADNGELLAVDMEDNMLFVFSSVGAELHRTVQLPGTDDSGSDSDAAGDGSGSDDADGEPPLDPVAMAMSGGKLYVLDQVQASVAMYQ